MRLSFPKTRGMLRREAASWLARLQGGRDQAAERKFRRWYEADPRHAEAFERVRRSYEQAGLLRQSPSVSARLSELPARPGSRPPRYALAAAAVLLAVLVPVAMFAGGGIMLGGTNAVMLASRIGEIRHVRLSDGSRLILDTASRVEVELGRSRREARLEQGRARFEIAPGGTPFVIEAGGTIVTIGGGVIDVARDGRLSRVAVVAGSAQVRGPGAANAAPLTLGAGSGATADSAGGVRKDEAAAGPDWTRGLLQFDGTPLAAAAAQANLYSTRHIVIDPGLGQLRVSGAFRAGDTGGFAKALAAAFHLSLRQAPDGSLVLSRGDASTAKKKDGG